MENIILPKELENPSQANFPQNEKEVQCKRELDKNREAYSRFFAYPLITVVNFSRDPLTRISEEINYVDNILDRSTALPLKQKLLAEQFLVGKFSLPEVPSLRPNEKIRDAYFFVGYYAEFAAWRNNNFAELYGLELAEGLALKEYSDILKNKIKDLRKGVKRKEFHIYNSVNGKEVNSFIEKTEDCFKLVNGSIGFDKLTFFRRRLEKDGYIPEETSNQTIRRIFSASNDGSKKNILRLQWLGDKSHLKYLIQYLINKKVIETKNQWQVVEKCFLDDNGQPIPRQEMRKIKIPTKESQIRIEKTASPLL